MPDDTPEKLTRFAESQSDERFIYEAFDHLKDMKPGKPNPITNTDVELCACGKKYVNRTEFTYLTTGITKWYDQLSGKPEKQVLDKICRECDQSVKDWCKIICVTCREVIARRKPSHDPKYGFTYKPGECYHVKNCPTCKPELAGQTTLVVEVEYHIRQNLNKKV